MFRTEEKLLVYTALFVMSFFIFASSAFATTLNFTVHAAEEATRSLSLAVDDRVVVKFTVVGGESGNTLDFKITYPNGTTKVSYINVGVIDYQFMCDTEGEYTLHFSNTSQEDRLVSIDYQVDHYILGMPQMLFLTMLIVGFCVGMVAVFILMGKPH